MIISNDLQHWNTNQMHTKDLFFKQLKFYFGAEVLADSVLWLKWQQTPSFGCYGNRLHPSVEMATDSILRLLWQQTPSFGYFGNRLHPLVETATDSVLRLLRQQTSSFG